MKVFVLAILFGVMALGCSPQHDLGDTAFHIRIDDMVLDQDALVVEESPRQSNGDDLSARAAGSFSVYSSQPWKNAVLPVVFDKAVPSLRRKQFLEWGEKWFQGTGVKVVARSRESDYLRVTYKNDGCYAQVGARRGQRRSLNLAPACWYEATVQHEIGHALGLMHEHQRPDRDNYIVLDLANVKPDNRFAFDRFATMNESEAYDFLSIMHYDETAFSFNGKRTILVRPQHAKYEGRYGIKAISDGDRRVMAKIYAQEVLSRETGH